MNNSTVVWVSFICLLIVAGLVVVAGISDDNQRRARTEAVLQSARHNSETEKYRIQSEIYKKALEYCKESNGDTSTITVDIKDILSLEKP